MFRLIIVSALVALAYGGVPTITRSRIPRLDGRIVGGEDVTIEEHPYQLSFELFGGHWCGASLIKTNFALTAAHCTDPVLQYVPYLTVRGGSTIREEGGQVAKVDSICQHSKFSEANSFDYDVAVLALASHLSLGVSVQLIPLQPVNSEVAEGALAVVTGWGALQSGGSSPKTLQKVHIPKITNTQCAESYPNENISDRMNCYGFQEGGKDACQGDSGGPLVVNGKQCGIVSWGYGCASPKRPGVYAKVANAEITDHIDTCMAKFV